MLKQILEYQVFTNSIGRYLVSIGILLIGVVGVKLFEKLCISRIKKMAEKTSTTIDDFLITIVEKIGMPLAYLGIAYFGLYTLALSKNISRFLDVLAVGVLTIFACKLIVRLIEYGLKNYWQQTTQTNVLEHSLSGILKVLKFIIWALAVIFFLDNLGFKISTVIAGLGIGGVAIALAAQAVLKDLFSYFSIIFDRPFEIGDFLIIGDHLGAVEHIGIKTTRIRSLSGEQLIFSNSDLTDSRLRNYKRMEKRRVTFKLGVVYETSLEKAKQIPGLIKEIITNINDTVFDRAHFANYGDFSLIFEVVYYVVGSDYNKYMDINQEINLNIKKIFEQLGIEFAFPTQTLHIAGQEKAVDNA